LQVDGRGGAAGDGEVDIGGGGGGGAEIRRDEAAGQPGQCRGERAKALSKKLLPWLLAEVK
jgi:hypothetical protein